MNVGEALDAFRIEMGKYPHSDREYFRYTAAICRDKLVNDWVLVGLDCANRSLSQGETGLLFESEDLVVISEDASSWRYWLSFLEGLVAGCLQRRDGSIASAIRGYNGWGFTRRPGSYRPDLDIDDEPCLLLEGVGPAVNNVAYERRIHHQLLPFGYQELYDITREHLGFPVGGASPCRISVAWSLDLRVKAWPTKSPYYSSYAPDDTIRLELECGPAWQRDDITASYNANIEGQMMRGRITTEQWMEERGEYGRTKLIREVKFPGGIQSAQLWVFHRAWQNEIYVISLGKQPTRTSPNLLWTAVQSTARTLNAGDKLKELLGLGPTGSQKDASRFEEALLTLLALFDYRCIPLGSRWQWQGIDFLALSADSQVLVVGSATVGANRVADHLRKLVPQVNAVRQALPDLRICPALFVCAESEDIVQDDHTACNRENIALVVLPQLDDLLGAALSGSAELGDALLRSILSP